MTFVGHSRVRVTNTPSSSQDHGPNTEYLPSTYWPINPWLRRLIRRHAIPLSFKLDVSTRWVEHVLFYCGGTLIELSKAEMENGVGINQDRGCRALIGRLVSGRRLIWPPLTQSIGDTAHISLMPLPRQWRPLIPLKFDTAMCLAEKIVSRSIRLNWCADDDVLVHIVHGVFQIVCVTLFLGSH